MIIIHYQKDKARYEELSKKEYESLTESGKEGDELNLEKGIDYNLADKGLRQMGAIMLDFQWNSMRASQGWWLGYADDLLFVAMDVGGGYKSASEVGLELAKTAATAVIGKGIGAGSNDLGDLAGKAMQGAGKVANFAVQAGISMTTNYVTSVANSAVNSLYIGQDGKLGFKTEDFTKSLYSANTISGALGAGITGGMEAFNYVSSIDV